MCQSYRPTFYGIYINNVFTIATIFGHLHISADAGLTALILTSELPFYRGYTPVYCFSKCIVALYRLGSVCKFSWLALLSVSFVKINGTGSVVSTVGCANVLILFWRFIVFAGFVASAPTAGNERITIHYPTDSSAALDNDANNKRTRARVLFRTYNYTRVQETPRHVLNQPLNYITVVAAKPRHFIVTTSLRTVKFL